MQIFDQNNTGPAVDRWGAALISGRACVGWAVLLLPMAAIVGSLCALFLWALDRVTLLRFAHPALLFTLPLAGMACGLAYQRFGRAVEGGNNLILEQVHQPDGGVPTRMIPLILGCTVISHLFGASVGREGTAVQVGGAVAHAIGRSVSLTPPRARILLMAGIAAGFGAVFGTPVAGAVFALEVLTIGRMDYAALVPALAASFIADMVCRFWGIRHTAYHIAFGRAANSAAFPVEPLLLAKTALAGILFGLASLLFSESVHRSAALLKRLCPNPWVRPAIGGVATIALVYALGTRDYLGLGVVSATPHGASIVDFFSAVFYPVSWLLKGLFTVVAIASGFKGGEVTPLFFIGAGLGNALAFCLHAPVDLFAGLGFVAVFAGASNTPIACTLMGIELFGGADTPYIAIACFLAYLCSGHSGIYLSQMVGVPKRQGHDALQTLSLRTIRDRHRGP